MDDMTIYLFAHWALSPNARFRVALRPDCGRKPPKGSKRVFEIVFFFPFPFLCRLQNVRKYFHPMPKIQNNRRSGDGGERAREKLAVAAERIWDCAEVENNARGGLIKVVLTIAILFYYLFQSPHCLYFLGIYHVIHFRAHLEIKF